MRLAWLTLLLGTGCLVDVPIDEKECDETHPCEDGFFCVDGSCSEQAPVDGGPADGTELGACYPNGTCNAGLTKIASQLGSLVGNGATFSWLFKDDYNVWLVLDDCETHID